MNRFPMRGWLLLACGLVACGAVHADDREERARIARERSEATERFQQRQRECEQRFAVTSCVDEARAEHRQALLRLRGQESVLDEAERKRRAAQRMAAIREKVSAEAARDAAPRPARPAPAMNVSAPRQKAAAPTPARVAASAASAPDRSAQEARSRERFEKRQREAKAHRDEAVRRQSERTKPGKTPVEPLPDPAAR
jgi:colicin import membrane protein